MMLGKKLKIFLRHSQQALERLCFDFEQLEKLMVGMVRLPLVDRVEIYDALKKESRFKG